MSTARMRRVNEVIREVVELDILGELQVLGLIGGDRHSRRHQLLTRGPPRSTSACRIREKEKERTWKASKCAALGIQLVGGQLHMKRTPTLKFVHDDLIERRLLTASTGRGLPGVHGCGRDRRRDETARALRRDRRDAQRGDKALQRRRRRPRTACPRPPLVPRGPRTGLRGRPVRVPGREGVPRFSGRAVASWLKEVFPRAARRSRLTADRLLEACGATDQRDYLRDGMRILNIDHHHGAMRPTSTPSMSTRPAPPRSSSRSAPGSVPRRRHPVASKPACRPSSPTPVCAENTTPDPPRRGAADRGRGRGRRDVPAALYERVPEEKPGHRRALGRIDRRLQGRSMTRRGLRRGLQGHGFPTRR